MKKKYWLITTENLKDRLWFKDEEDYKAGMNIVALLSVTMPVVVVAFILMSNHVHFILLCTEEDALAFINKFKERYSKYFRLKYSYAKSLRRNGVDIQEVSLRDESFERALAYVQMNCVAANICLYPGDYPWGTGGAFFNPYPSRGIPLEQMSGRALARMVHSRQRFPSGYVADERGFIDPHSYVPVKMVESIFRTPKRMNFFLMNSSKAKRRKELPSFSDQMVINAIRELAVSMFHTNSPSELNDGQKSELLRQVRYRLSSDPAQIARAAGLTYEEVVRFLEMI